MAIPTVGINVSHTSSRDPAALQRVLGQIAEAGLDRVFVGDHVSFHDGRGVDGLIAATAYLMLHPTLRVFVAVYLLPLRQPVLVARQLATISEYAPGRLALGIGVAGEDRHEVEICGVDPSSRGRRTDEAMQVLRGLRGGAAYTFEGEFFRFQEARIRPAPGAVPLIVGGRSNAAILRAGRFGDGWLGIWNSPRRFSEATELIAAEAARVGRGNVDWQHGMQVWCGFGRSAEEARPLLASAMEQTYKLPYERFERYAPAGPPAHVAAFLRPYLEVGCSSFNLVAIAADTVTAIESAAEVKRLLESRAGG